MLMENRKKQSSADLEMLNSKLATSKIGSDLGEVRV